MDSGSEVFGVDGRRAPIVPTHVGLKPHARGDRGRGGEAENREGAHKDARRLHEGRVETQTIGPSVQQ